MPVSDETPQRFQWLSNELDRSLQRLKQTMATAASFPVKQWQNDWSRYRASVFDRLDLIDAVLEQLLPAEESLQFRLVPPFDDERRTLRTEAA